MDFETLFRLYSEEIYRYLRYMLGNDEDARDLMQDTFLKAWKHLGNLEDAASFRSWLYRIATNEALNHIRRRKLFSLLRWPQGNSWLTPPAIKLDEWILLKLALERVRPKYRQCLVLQEIKGFSQRDIADIVGISESSVSKYVKRGYEELIQAYQYLDSLFRENDL